MASGNYLASKPRYEILDGLRGVAAMIVVAFHLFETYSGDPTHQILNHGYLAVDFFFALSGFVIGYAYDDRWGKMSLKDFFKRRLVRLHPMVICGTLFGASLFYFGESSAFPFIEKASWGMALLMTLLGCLMIPVGPSLDIRGWGEVNTLNGPAWSLMWEYAANIIYALFIRHLSRTLLFIFVLLSGMLTLDLTLNIDVFNVYSANREGAAYTVIGGWSLTPDQLYIGLSRLLYPFFAGLLLSKFHRYIKVRNGFWWCALFIAAILVMPHVGGAEHKLWDGVYNAVCILVLFPIIVAMGAGSEVVGERSTKVCKFLGEISYPLYITHYPLIYLQIAFASNHPDASLGQIVFMSIFIFILSIGIAYASLHVYDLPVREWLKKHWLMRK